MVSRMVEQQRVNSFANDPAILQQTYQALALPKNLAKYN
jgi:hypothetical protein